MIDKGLKEQFIKDVKDKDGGAEVLVVAVLLQNGAIEVISNTQGLEDKIKYYLEKYDDSFRLITAPLIQIVGYMLV